MARPVRCASVTKQGVNDFMTREEIHYRRPRALWLTGRLLAALLLGLLAAAGARASTESLPKGLRFVPGPVNGAVIERDGRTLVIYGDPSGRVSAEMVLLAEARRDAVWAARAVARRGAEVVAPDGEADVLNHPGKFWAEFREKRFHRLRSTIEPGPDRASARKPQCQTG
jgi:hypothetical protein